MPIMLESDALEQHGKFAKSRRDSLCNLHCGWFLHSAYDGIDSNAKMVGCGIPPRDFIIESQLDGLCCLHN
jgi:hypothetical protein